MKHALQDASNILRVFSTVGFTCFLCWWIYIACLAPQSRWQCDWHLWGVGATGSFGARLDFWAHPRQLESAAQKLCHGFLAVPGVCDLTLSKVSDTVSDEGFWIHWDWDVSSPTFQEHPKIVAKKIASIWGWDTRRSLFHWWWHSAARLRRHCTHLWLR